MPYSGTSAYFWGTVSYYCLPNFNISHPILWFLMSKRDDLWNFFVFIKTNLRTNNIWLRNSFKTFKLLCLPQLHAKITCFNQFLITDSLSLHRKCIINDMLLFYETRDTKIWPPQKWMKGPKFNLSSDSCMYCTHYRHRFALYNLWYGLYWVNRYSDLPFWLYIFNVDET